MLNSKLKLLIHYQELFTMIDKNKYVIINVFEEYKLTFLHLHYLSNKCKIN